MHKRCLIIGLVPVELLLSACAEQPSQTVAVDASGREAPAYAQGYAALKGGDNMAARRYFAQSYAARPADPFEEVNYAAALQNTGDIRSAIPLYRDAIARGSNLYGTDYTRPEVRGMSVADVARWNLAQAGRDQAGNLIRTRQGAALVAPGANRYEVYFEFDRADVTPGGQAIIRQAARSATAGNLVRLTLTGDTDTSGPREYNRTLSMRRADAVAHALIAGGVPPGDILARGVGESDLAVPTGDGVREPRNRRVEIVSEEARVD
jgi:flagellar motor protein MotB